MSRPIPPVTLEPFNPRWLQRTVGADSRMVLEIGAHHGTHTDMLLTAFPQAAVHAFEPDPRAIEVHRRTIRDRRATLHELAIGAENGKAEFHVSSGLPPEANDATRKEYPKGWDQSGSLRAPKNHTERYPWVKFVRTIRVDVRTLDTFAAKHGIDSIDLIWADMQGAEGDLAKGGAQTLARTRFLYCEYSDEELYEGEPSLAALLDMLPGFDIVKRFPHDVLLRNERLVAAAP
ncbi:MAG: hypothetical protein RLY21_1242 [Planctomycetota bacterium]|jgi:FkbM family methyltransferase